jgi:hypothetical protein
MDVVERLERVLHELEDARLAKEDTLCHEYWPLSRKRPVLAACTWCCFAMMMCGWLMLI